MRRLIASVEKYRKRKLQQGVSAISMRCGWGICDTLILKWRITHGLYRCGCWIAIMYRTESRVLWTASTSISELNRWEAYEFAQIPLNAQTGEMKIITTGDEATFAVPEMTTWEDVQ